MSYLFRSLIFGLSVATWLLAGGRAGELLPPSRGGIGEGGGALVVDDARIHAELLRQGVPFIESRRASPAAILIAQLSRGSCELKLSKTDTRDRSRVDIASKGRASVVVVARLYRTGIGSGWMVASASGFYISSTGGFVTSCHVVSSPDYEGIVVMNADGLVFPVVEVLAADPCRDVAILRADVKSTPPLALEAGVLVGSTISIMSHPLGRYFSYTVGVVSRRSRLHEDQCHREVMDVTAEFGPGSSGGPVMNERGHVVGWVDSLRSLSGSAGGSNSPGESLTFRECGVSADILRLVRRR